jgi:hypothetical protein
MNESTEQDPIVNVEDIPERELVARRRAIQVQGPDAWGGDKAVRADDPLWQELRILGDKISDVRVLLDDLPSRVKTLEKLEVKVDPSFSPTFWAIVILIVLFVAAMAFWVGGQV